MHVNYFSCIFNSGHATFYQVKSLRGTLIHCFQVKTFKGTPYWFFYLQIRSGKPLFNFPSPPKIPPRLDLVHIRGPRGRFKRNEVGKQEKIDWAATHFADDWKMLASQSGEEKTKYFQLVSWRVMSSWDEWETAATIAASKSRLVAAINDDKLKLIQH